MARTTTPSVIDSLEILEAVLDENREAERQLRRLIAHARKRHAAGETSWWNIFEEKAEGDLIRIATAMYVRLGDATGPFQRAVVSQLTSEGLTASKIATLFNVSPQRIGNIIRQIGRLKAKK